MRQLERTQARNPEDWWPRIYLAAAYARLGRIDAALIANISLGSTIGPSAAPPGRSATGGEAGGTGRKADVAARRSASECRAVGPAGWPEQPLVATSRERQDKLAKDRG